jgi:hypothetical protein
MKKMIFLLLLVMHGNNRLQQAETAYPHSKMALLG